MAAPLNTLDELFRIPPPRPSRRGPAPPASDRPREVQRILSLTVPVAVKLAERDIPLEAILKITVGTILEFDVSAETELTLSIGGEPIGTGQAVKVGENFGLRVSRVLSVRDRIAAMRS
jgi:flagellar motor switch protein FliN